jgi:hypothetical protein
MVDWGDRDGGCYVNTFDGPMAEQRAREYFDALKGGRLKVLREIELPSYGLAEQRKRIGITATRSCILEQGSARYSARG